MKKKSLNTLGLLLFVGLIGWISWSQFSRDERPFVFLEGKALGVFYAISYQSDPLLEKDLDSLINEFDQIVNLDLPLSEVSRFNRYGTIENYSPHLFHLLQESKKYHRISGGVVSHSILPLITAWGRDFSKKREMSQERVDSLIALCDISNIEIKPESINSRLVGVMLDLNYLDKGYLIDQLSKYLRRNGVTNFQIEFGIDGITSGTVKDQNAHNFIINLPKDLKEKTLITNKIKLKNIAYSSSGSLDKFYVDEKGNKHSHLIDPRTGLPLANGILSTHIKSSSCLHADAMATICMILSLEESQKLIEKDPYLEGMIIYNQNGDLRIWQSKGFNKTISRFS
jgi:FAD:protein FMN transferase